MTHFLRGLFSRQRKGVVKTESVFQLEAAECGVASLAIILSYFGRRLPIEELRSVCGVSRDGSNAANLLKAARAYGLEAKGLKAELDQIQNLTPPMIAFVNFNHFLVINGIKGNKVYLNDPAVGPHVVTLQAFDAMYTGVVLTFSAGEDFKTGNSRPPVWRALLARTSGFRMGLGYLFLVSLLLVIPGIIIPIFSRVFVDQILIQGLDDWLLPLIIGMLLTALLRMGLSMLQTHHLTRAETQLAIKGSQALFAHILHLPIAYFGARYAGEIAGRLRLNDRLAALLTGEIARAALSFISALFFLAIIFLYSWRVALAVALINAINLYVLLSVSRKLADGYHKLAIDEGKLHGVSISGLQDIETFKASGSEANFFTRLSGLHAKVVDEQQKMGSAAIVAGSFPVLSAALTTAAVLIIGGLEAMQGALSIGAIVALQSLASSFSAPLATLINFGTRIQDVKSNTQRIDDVLQHQLIETQPPLGSVDAPAKLPQGALFLNQIAFGYLPLEPPFIDNFCLDIKQGSRIAIVGASGSGKSTLGRLIAGLFPPVRGQILLDKVPLSNWPASVLSSSLAHVDQECHLFEGSIRDNLTLWNKSLPETDMIRAAHDALIHEMISSRPGGYAANVEEGGRNFSGGQRQRLEIARALSLNPKILVLDEATSALDPVTEIELMENLSRRGCTLIIIAHRLSTIRDCDEIIVMENGEPIERGTHQALVSSGGVYQVLIQE